MQKTVVVTGASRGIGAAIAARFARSGWHTVLNYHRSRERALQLEAELRAEGCSVLAVPGDVSVEADADRLIDTAAEHFGRLDCLVNNAGVALDALLTDTALEDWDRLFAVNATGTFLCSRAALRHMVRRKSGSIVNISSMWGQVGASCEAAYSASKAAVIGLTRALAKEVGPSDVRVNCIAPGVIDTEMNGALTAEDLESLRQETPLLRIGTPGDIAETALFLAEDKSSFLTGQVLGVNGGFVI